VILHLTYNYLCGITLPDGRTYATELTLSNGRLYFGIGFFSWFALFCLNFGGGGQALNAVLFLIMIGAAWMFWRLLQVKRAIERIPGAIMV